MATLPCPDGAGSLNNEEAPAQQGTNTPLVVVQPCIGTWEISTADDECAINEASNQASYAASVLNINGAPLNIYKLKGIHEQGVGSILSRGKLFSSASAPGFPLSSINTSSWKSMQTGVNISGVAHVGIDFGIDTKIIAGSTSSEYAPIKPNWQKVGAVIIKQADTPFNFARQVRVEIADGATVIGSSTSLSTGTLSLIQAGPNAEAGTITAIAASATALTITYTKLGTTITLGSATVGTLFQSTICSFVISGAVTLGDMFSFNIDYEWKRVGVYNLVQGGSPITLNLQHEHLVKAVRVVPTLFTANSNWVLEKFDVLDTPPTNVNNIQDLFFNENRDRDYEKVPLQIKAQYTMSDSITDLSKFGLSMLDAYSFVVSFPAMIGLLGRPIVTGDIVEVIPELQYDHNLKPVKKFVEVTDTGWAAEGFTSGWKPTLYRFAASVVNPSQETRDIFGTIDTQKYMVADSFFSDLGAGPQIDTTPLTQTEEIIKTAKAAVPEIGTDSAVSTDGQPLPLAQVRVNVKGNPAAISAGNGKQGPMVEDGLPPNGEIYGEGYALPDIAGSVDGAWFRLYYPEATMIPTRLYRFSALKNKWIYMETDRRMENSSIRPSIQKIMQSTTKIGLGKKQI